MDEFIITGIYILIGLVLITIPILFLWWLIRTYKRKQFELLAVQILVTIACVGGYVANKFNYDGEVGSLESSLSLKLPNDYKVIRSKNEGLGSDYLIELEVQLNDVGRRNIIDQIRKSKNYITDSMKLSQYIANPIMRDNENKLGYWTNVNDVYLYNEPFENPEPVQCELSADGVIAYTFVHL